MENSGGREVTLGDYGKISNESGHEGDAQNFAGAEEKSYFFEKSSQKVFERAGYMAPAYPKGDSKEEEELPLICWHRKSVGTSFFKVSCMYPAKPGLLIGFHGCEKSVRDAVVSGNTMLKPSQNKYDWLGSGFYFWEDNYERALDFAIHPPGKKRIMSPAVLGAVLELRNCLNLMNTEHINVLKTSYHNLLEPIKLFSKTLPSNKGQDSSGNALLRELDCFVIENVHKQRKFNNKRPYDSVRGLFVEGEPIYENAGFHEKNHIQICIRNPNCIKGFFIPRQEVRWRA